MTPGSASARIEKETKSGSGDRSGAAAGAGETEGCIANFLGRQFANRRDPGPNGTRDANSPDAGAMRRHVHGPNVSRRAVCVKNDLDLVLISQPIADWAQRRSVELNVLPYTAQQPKPEQRQHREHKAQIREIVEDLQPTPEQAAADHLIAMQRRHYREGQLAHRDRKPLSQEKKPEIGI